MTSGGESGTAICEDIVKRLDGHSRHRAVVTMRCMPGRASGLRDSRGDVSGPVLHQLAAMLEQITASVGRSAAVAVDVRKGEFTDCP